MTFLSALEERGRALARRYSEIRSIIASAEAVLPSDPGVTNGIRVPFSIRDRLTEVQSRHGIATTRDTIYKCMMLGLVTLERLEPASTRVTPQRRRDTGSYRVLSEADVSRIRDEGYSDGL